MAVDRSPLGPEDEPERDPDAVDGTSGGTEDARGDGRGGAGGGRGGTGDARGDARGDGRGDDVVRGDEPDPGPVAHLRSEPDADPGAHAQEPRPDIRAAKTETRLRRWALLLLVLVPAIYFVIQKLVS